MATELTDIELMDSIASKSNLAGEDVQEIGQIINEGVAERLKDT